MTIREPYHLFSEPLQYYNAMIEDIKVARNYILIETFRIGNDEMGRRFLMALQEAAKRGVSVKILIDYWGAGSTKNGFFDPLIEKGGEVRFFEKIKFKFDFFTKGHKRNHRKLLLIDDKITYIGSTNLTGYNINWRESVLRMVSEITITFKKLFLQDYKIYNQYIFSRNYYTRRIKYHNFEIIRDVPNIAFKRINRIFIEMIKDSKQDVVIETPYFLPGYLLRKALSDAARRGVEVKIIIPKKSDVTLVDILRNKYLGPLSMQGIKILFYEPNNLHAKILFVDGSRFAIGSSNFDYRSFRYMFEIILTGNDADIAEQMEEHVEQTLKNTTPFVYDSWKNRSFPDKFFEWLLIPFRHLL